MHTLGCIAQVGFNYDYFKDESNRQVQDRDLLCHWKLLQSQVCKLLEEQRF